MRPTSNAADALAVTDDHAADRLLRILGTKQQSDCMPACRQCAVPLSTESKKESIVWPVSYFAKPKEVNQSNLSSSSDLGLLIVFDRYWD